MEGLIPGCGAISTKIIPLCIHVHFPNKTSHDAQTAYSLKKKKGKGHTDVSRKPSSVWDFRTLRDVYMRNGVLKGLNRNSNPVKQTSFRPTIKSDREEHACPGPCGRMLMNGT